MSKWDQAEGLLKELPQEVRGFLPRSRAMQEAYAKVYDFARNDMPILLHGPTGTGKEYLARFYYRALEFWRKKSSEPIGHFHPLNCAGLSETIAASDLFGIEERIATGVWGRPGLFQIAEDGVLFLDEIGDLSPKGQGDLLRVLEDGAFRMVGGTELVGSPE